MDGICPVRRIRLDSSAMLSTSFELIGSDPPEHPVILSVPHAGRAYPDALLQALRVPRSALIGLEDRYIDAVALAARGSATMLVQCVPRAWIDLNRSESERDPKVDTGALVIDGIVPSLKLRSGLGLVPRQVAGTGALWKRRFEGHEIDMRIAHAHRPYHAALHRLLNTTRSRFGIAVLLDIHSMPPLGGSNRAGVVVGDRYGQASAAQYVSRVESVVAGYGIRLALNAPYAGGHILERHGDPVRNVHAIQLEIDRTFYLDRNLRKLGTGASRINPDGRRSHWRPKGRGGRSSMGYRRRIKKPPRTKSTRWPRFREVTR